MTCSRAYVIVNYVAAPEFDRDRLVTIQKFTMPWMAEIAAAKLRAAGIDCQVTGESLARIDWALALADGGSALRVLAGDAAEAIAVLEDVNEPTPAASPPEAVSSRSQRLRRPLGAARLHRRAPQADTSPQRRCPNCQSLRLAPTNPGWLAALRTLLGGYCGSLRCRDCGQLVPDKNARSAGTNLAE